MTQIMTLGDHANPAFGFYMCCKKYISDLSVPFVLNKAVHNFYDYFPQLKSIDRSGLKSRIKYDLTFGGKVAINSITCYAQPKHYGCEKFYLFKDKSVCVDVSCSHHPVNVPNDPKRCNGRNKKGIIWYHDPETNKFLLHDDPLLIRRLLIKDSIPLKEYISKLYQIPPQDVGQTDFIIFQQDFHLSQTHIRLFFRGWEEFSMHRRQLTLTTPHQQHLGQESSDSSDAISHCDQLMELNQTTNRNSNRPSGSPQQWANYYNQIEKRLYEIKPFHITPMLKELHLDYLSRNDEVKSMLVEAPELTKTVSIMVNPDDWKNFHTICNRHFGLGKVSRLVSVFANYAVNNDSLMQIYQNGALSKTVSLSVDHVVWNELKVQLIERFGIHKIQSKVIAYLVEVFVNTNMFPIFLKSDLR